MVKRKYAAILALMAFAAAVSCTREEILGTQTGQNETYVPDGAGVVEGWVRVKLTDGSNPLPVGTFTRGNIASGDAELDAVASMLGATEVKRVFNDGGRFAERRRKWGLHLWYDVKFDESLPVSRAVSELGTLGNVAYAQPIPQIKILDAEPGIPSEMVFVPSQMKITRPEEMFFNDPELSMQWHYNNTGSMSGSVAGSDINAFAAWDKTAGNPAVIVAVTDEGIQYDHPDLAANIWVNEAEKNGTPGEDDDNNGYVDDVYGWNTVYNKPEIIPMSHGTHVAGTVAAVNNNGVGVCGVAGGTGKNDGAKIMIVQIYDDTDPSIKENAATRPDAFVYAADNGAVISQNSWAYMAGTALDGAVSDAIDYFIANAGWDDKDGDGENDTYVGPMDGGIMCFAAGNENSGVLQPAADPRVIGVAAVGVEYKKGAYSNYGESIDISAPGGTYASGGNNNTTHQIYSTDINGTYSYKYGTSMATPHVSGVAALIISYYGDLDGGTPAFTEEQCKEILLRSYRSIGAYNKQYEGKLGIGLLDAGLIFAENPETAPAEVTNPTGSVLENFVTLQWTAPADGNGEAVASFRVRYVGEGIGKREGLEPVNGEFLLNNEMAPGETFSYRWTGIYNTEYTFNVSAIDRYGNESAGEVGFTCQTGDFTNSKPSRVKAFDDLVIAAAGEDNAVTFTLTEYFSDSDIEKGDALRYEIINQNEDIVKVEVSKDGIMTVTPLAKGSLRIMVNCYDLSGEMVQNGMSITVQNGPTPSEPVEPGAAESIQLRFNPVVEELRIVIGDKSMTAELTVYDAAARLVMQRSVAFTDGNAAVDVQSLASGVYSLVVSYGDVRLNTTFVKK